MSFSRHDASATRFLPYDSSWSDRTMKADPKPTPHVRSWPSRSGETSASESSASFAFANLTTAAIESCGHDETAHRYICLHCCGLARHLLPQSCARTRIPRLIRAALRYRRSGQHLLPHACNLNRQRLVLEDAEGIHLRGQ